MKTYKDLDIYHLSYNLAIKVHQITLKLPKYELYEEAGVKEYWIVNPVEENIVVFILNKQRKLSGLKMYAGEDTIYSSSVPGLNINVSDIFTN